MSGRKASEVNSLLRSSDKTRQVSMSILNNSKNTAEKYVRLA